MPQNLQLRQKVDKIKEKARTQSRLDITDCDKLAKAIVKNVSYVKLEFTNCIDKNVPITAAYHQRIITAINDLRGYLNVMHNYALIQRRNTDSDVKRASNVSLIKCHIRSEN